MMKDMMFTGTDVFLIIESFALNSKSFRKKVLEERLSTKRFEEWLQNWMKTKELYQKHDIPAWMEVM